MGQSCRRTLSTILHGRLRVCSCVVHFRTDSKPGASHVRGTGQALRRAGCDAAMQFSAETFAQCTFPYPLVQTNQTIVEAFPNAFLGVLIDEQVIDEAAPSRGQKTDIFFSLCNNHGVFQQLEQYLVWQDAAFWAAFQTTSNHEDIAALVCAATAICAHLGKYGAVGDVSGGYFFLPPWYLWKPWAMAALDSARKKSGLRNIVRVWMAGSSYGPNDRLP